MRRWVGVLGWFGLGLVVVLGVAEVSARVAEAAGPPVLRWYDASTQLKVAQMDGRGDTDVVFAGTSMVWQGMIPEVFTATDPEGRSAYNAGLAGGVPVVMEPWLTEEVVPRLHPQVVIWGLSSMDLSASYGEDNLERYRDALATRTGTLAAVEQFTARYSTLVRYRTILRRPSALFGTERTTIEDDFTQAAATLGPDGERRNYTIDLSPERAAQVQARLRDYRIDPTDLQAITRTIDTLQAQGITVILAEMPVPNRYVTLHPQGAQDTTRAHHAITTLAELTNTPLIDLRYGYTDNDYVDYTHLNHTAATTLTTTLTNHLNGTDSETPAPATTTTTTTGAGPTAATTTTLPPTTTTTEPAVPLDEALATANRAIEVFDLAYHELLGGGNVLHTPAYWTFGQHLGKYIGLAKGAETGGFDVVMVGSSLVVNGFDPGRFAGDDGRSAFNAGIARLGPEQAAIWLRSVLRLADPELVMIGLAPRDVRSLSRVEGACVDSVADWEWSEQLRTAAFAPVDIFDGVYWETLLFGTPVQAELPAIYADEFDDLGGRIVYDRQTQQEIEQAMASAAWEGPLETCPERFDAVAAEVAEVKAAGAKAVVVFMPMSGNRVSMFEGGRDEIAGILGRIEQVAVAAGADAVIDFSALLPDDQFRDLSHADREGSLTFTDALAEEIARLGL